MPLRVDTDLVRRMVLEIEARFDPRKPNADAETTALMHNVSTSLSVLCDEIESLRPVREQLKEARDDWDEHRDVIVRCADAFGRIALQLSKLYEEAREEKEAEEEAPAKGFGALFESIMKSARVVQLDVQQSAAPSGNDATKERPAPSA